MYILYLTYLDGTMESIKKRDHEQHLDNERQNHLGLLVEKHLERNIF